MDDATSPAIIVKINDIADMFPIVDNNMNTDKYNAERLYVERKSINENLRFNKNLNASIKSVLVRSARNNPPKAPNINPA